MTVTRRVCEDGLPGIVVGNVVNNVYNVYYRLYRLDGETGQTVLMGRTPCDTEFDTDILWVAHEPIL